MNLRTDDDAPCWDDQAEMAAQRGETLVMETAWYPSRLTMDVGRVVQRSGRPELRLIEGGREGKWEDHDQKS